MLKKFVGVLLVAFLTMMSCFAQDHLKPIIEYEIGGSYYFAISEAEFFNGYLFDDTEAKGYMLGASFPIAHINSSACNDDYPNVVLCLIFKKEKEAKKFIKDYKKIYDKFEKNYLNKNKNIKFFEKVTRELYNLTKKIKYDKNKDIDYTGEYYKSFELWYINNVRY